MKKKIGSLLIAFMMVMAMVPSLAFAETTTPDEIPITEEYFPDKAFREYVLTEIDYNEDGILSASEIEDTDYIDVYDEGIRSLEGLQYFSYLEWLYCEDNYLTDLPDLPESLTVLDCDDNLLSELPELPDGLESLYCSNNKLTVMPKLPDGLKCLFCYNNNLESLPQLPDGLEELLCGSNELTKLPALPKTIKELWAANNKLTGVLDISQQMFLKSVYLDGNLLTGLIVSADAKYEDVDLDDNCMAGKNAVTGRDDIDWDDVFYFGYQAKHCNIYGHNFEEFETYKAYVSQSYAYEGYRYKVCSKCGDATWLEDECEEIPAVKQIKLSTTSYTYDGKSKKPTVTVYDSNGKKISSENYSISYASGRKNVGKYKVTVKFKGDYYEGSRYVTFKINPKPTTISSISKGKQSFTVKWKKQSGKMAKSRITGYQYRYSTSSKMTSSKTVTVKGYSKTSAKKTGLKAKQKYYVQVRTYKTVDGVKYYSSWSKAKSVKTK